MKLPQISAGDIFTNTKGCEFTVVEYKNSDNVRVVFNDKHAHECVAQSGNIRRGNVKNPYHPNVFGVGYVGHGKYNSNKGMPSSHIYVKWRNMMNRCYGDNKKWAAYRGCSVHRDWHNFQSFAEWYENQNKEKSWELDKDVLVKGNKIYSPETCRLVPSEINVMFTSNAINRGSLPIGVVFERGRFVASISIKGERVYLGSYATQEQAFEAYKKAKEENIKYTAESYKDRLDSDVYEALMRYSVLITD